MFFLSIFFSRVFFAFLSICCSELSGMRWVVKFLPRKILLLRHCWTRPNGTHMLSPPPLVVSPPPPPRHSVFPPAPSPASDTPARWSCFPADPSLGVELSEDALLCVLSKLTAVDALRRAKAVSMAWRRAARDTLCSLDWLVSSGVTLLSLLKVGNPSPALAVSLAEARPSLLNERDVEGMLPLQFAAAYRKGRPLVLALREVTAGRVPGGVPALSAELCRLRLRPVHTRVREAPVAA